jgi:predicted esterase
LEAKGYKYPLMIIRGTRDNLLKREYADQVAAFHRETGHPVEFLEYPGGHTWQPTVNTTIADFIERNRS